MYLIKKKSNGLRERVETALPAWVRDEERERERDAKAESFSSYQSETVRFLSIFFFFLGWRESTLDRE